jgi:hypothetical protein
MIRAQCLEGFDERSLQVVVAQAVWAFSRHRISLARRIGGCGVII